MSQVTSNKWVLETNDGFSESLGLIRLDQSISTSFFFSQVLRKWF